PGPRLPRRSSPTGSLSRMPLKRFEWRRTRPRGPSGWCSSRDEGQPMKRIEGRVAVVTGAASGIGLAIADRLAAAGATVVMTDINEAALDQAVRPLADRGSNVAAKGLDVRDLGAVERLADQIVDDYGALHIAVNNAGIVNRG